jgi:dUTP pyrophosphatase
MWRKSTLSLFFLIFLTTYIIEGEIHVMSTQKLGLKYYASSDVNNPPKYKHAGDACFDIEADCSNLKNNSQVFSTLFFVGTDQKYPDIVLKPGDRYIIPTGLFIECAHGYELQIRPRSGLSSKGIAVAFGTIDENYRGEIGVIIANNSDTNFNIKHGDRIAQGAYKPVTEAMFIAVNSQEDLSKTTRGADGFGSTGTEK